MWVPFHIGIVRNKKTDKYADRARKPFQILILRTYLLRTLKSLWIKKYSHLGKITGTQYHRLTNSKILKKKKTVKKWNTPFNFDRRWDIAITRTRIGHLFLNYSYLISKEPQPICDSCDTTLIIKHIVKECTQFSLTRTDLNISHSIAEALDEGKSWNHSIFKYHKYY